MTHSKRAFSLAGIRRDVLGILVLGGIGIAAGLQSGLIHQFAALTLRHEAVVFEYIAPVLCLLAVTALYVIGRRYGDLKADNRRRGRTDDQVSRFALSDALTGLANRPFFMSTLTTRLAGQHRDARRVAVLRLGLDGFRSVEDQHGQAVADMLLQAVAQRVKTVLGETDGFARFGADAFAIALAHQNANDLGRIVTRILAALDEPLVIGSLSCRIAAGLGVAVSSMETPLSAEDMVLSLIHI